MLFSGKVDCVEKKNGGIFASGYRYRYRSEPQPARRQVRPRVSLDQDHSSADFKLKGFYM